jgi:hypothetical protein
MGEERDAYRVLVGKPEGNIVVFIICLSIGGIKCIVR